VPTEGPSAPYPCFSSILESHKFFLCKHQLFGLLALLSNPILDAGPKPLLLRRSSKPFSVGFSGVGRFSKTGLFFLLTRLGPLGQIGSGFNRPVLGAGLDRTGGSGSTQSSQVTYGKS